MPHIRLSRPNALTPEQGGRAPRGHRGGRAGWEKALQGGTARGTHSARSAWGGGGPGSVAGCESRAAVRFWHHLLDKSFPRNKARNAVAERVGQGLPPDPTRCTRRCTLCPLPDCSYTTACTLPPLTPSSHLLPPLYSTRCPSNRSKVPPGSQAGDMVAIAPPCLAILGQAGACCSLLAFPARAQGPVITSSERELLRQTLDGFIFFMSGCKLLVI